MFVSWEGAARFSGRNYLPLMSLSSTASAFHWWNCFAVWDGVPNVPVFSLRLALCCWKVPWQVAGGLLAMP